MNCPVCSSIHIKTKFIKQSFSFLQCATCKLIFIEPQPSADVLQAFYTKDYYKPWGDSGIDAALVQKNKARTFARWLDIIEKYQQSAKILDIGCAFGLFLDVARSRGWDPYGVEIAGYAAEKAQGRFAGRIIKGDVFAAQYPSGFYDVVTMFDVIEHVPSLSLFLAEVNRILRPGGWVVFSTVNTASISAHVLGAAWPHYKLEHLYYLNPDNFRKLLAGHGFLVKRLLGVRKFLSIGYIDSYLRSYPIPVLRRFSRFMQCMVPVVLRGRGFPVATGEMLVIARKA